MKDNIEKKKIMNKSTIFTWTDPLYFKFARGLMNSIRCNGNDQKIILHLMDFDDEQSHLITEAYKQYNVEVWTSAWYDSPVPIKNRFEYYRNNRPRYFIKALEQEERLITLGANGLVHGNLNYLESHIDANDWVFLERQKKDVISPEKEPVMGIHDLKRKIKKYELNINDVMNTTSGKVVLLGTHAFKKSNETFKVLNLWRNRVENTKTLDKRYSDMNLFVTSIMDIETEINKEFSMYTAINEKREGNSICDTHFQSQKIWFAKSSTKHKNKTYLKSLNEYIRKGPFII